MAQALGVVLPVGLALVQGLLVVLGVGGMRFWLRSLIRQPGLRDAMPVIIYGAGRAGQQLVAALNLGLDYRPVAFVDDDPRLHGATVNGVPVHPVVELRQLIRHWHVREVLLAMPSLERTRRKRIVSRLETLSVEVKTIPAMGDLVSGQARVTDLRPVMPEDMLGRDPVPPRARNDTLRTTRHYGRAFWKRWAGYYIRSRIEARMRCLKSFGERIAAKDPDRRNPDTHRTHEPILGPLNGRDCSRCLRPTGKGTIMPQA